MGEARSIYYLYDQTFCAAAFSFLFFFFFFFDLTALEESSCLDQNSHHPQMPTMRQTERDTKGREVGQMILARIRPVHSVRMDAKRGPSADACFVKCELTAC